VHLFLGLFSQREPSHRHPTLLSGECGLSFNQTGVRANQSQWSEGESIFAVDLPDPQVLMGREHCRSATVGFIELLGEGLNLSLG
jgi:hypothetical protein